MSAAARPHAVTHVGALEHDHRVHDREADEEDHGEDGEGQARDAGGDRHHALGGRREQGPEGGQRDAHVDDEADEEQAAPRGEPVAHGRPVVHRLALLDPAEGGEGRAHDQGIEHDLDGEHRLQRLDGPGLGRPEELEIVPEDVPGQPDGERDQREEVRMGGEEPEGLPEQGPHAT